MSTLETQEVRAVAKWVHMSPRKARLVTRHISGRSVPEARTVLAFTQRAAAREIDSTAAANWLTTASHQHSESFLWLHFSLSNTAAIRWLRAHLELPDAFYESLHENAVSTRLEQEGEDLVAVILDVLFDSTVDSSTISSVSILVCRR